MAADRVSVPVPFLVIAALVPEITPETSMVRPGFTVQVFVVLAKARSPVTELFPVAVKSKFPAPVPDREKLEEIFKVPVRDALDVPRQSPLPALAPETVRVPVPASAVKELKPYQLLDLPIETSKLIAPLVALVSRARFPPLLPLRPKSPVSVMLPAVIVVSATSSIPFS